MLVDILREKGSLLSDKFVEAYLQKSKELGGIHAIAECIFNPYAKPITEMDLINAKRAFIRGQVREYASA